MALILSVCMATFIGCSGKDGTNGQDGADGKSAYQIWLELGNEGSEQDFIDWLKGEKGDTGANGQDGANGKSAYEIWLAEGNEGTIDDFINWLKGSGTNGKDGVDGEDGKDGTDGKSAYDIWLKNGHTGTEVDFLNWLKGETGASGSNGEDGKDGANGLSAYEIWLKNDHTGTEADFLEWLQASSQQCFVVAFSDGVVSQIVVSGEYATIPTAPTKTGYEFVKWDYDFTKPITSSTTINAEWKALEYNLTYDLNNAVDNGGNPVKFTIEDLPLQLKDATAKTGYEFSHWYIDGNENNNISTITELKDVKVYAKSSRVMINGSVGSPLKDTNVNETYDIFMFGGHAMGSYNLDLALKDMIEMYTDSRVKLSAIDLGPGNVATTFNLYELFASTARNNAEDYTFYTFSSSSRVNALNALQNDSLDCIILQLGRDYSLVNAERTSQNQLSAIKIAKVARNNNPNVKIMLVAPYAQQLSYTATGMTSNGIVDFISHQDLIDQEVINTQKAILEAIPDADVEIFSLGDLFESYSSNNEEVKADLYCTPDDVNSLNNAGNKANSKGAYLGAAGLFTALMDTSPVGLRSFGVNANGADGRVNDVTALAMQKLAYKFVMNGQSSETVDIFYRNEVYSSRAKALIAVADAYVRRGAMVQYDDTRIMKANDANLDAEYRGKHGMQAPELATEQNTVYTNCAAWINSLFFEAFNYDIVSWFTNDFIDRTDMQVLYQDNTGTETTLQKNAIIDNVKSVLRPGDLIVYRYVNDEGGHILLYVGNDKYIHSRGSNYNYGKPTNATEYGEENYESVGSVCYESVKNTLFRLGDARCLAEQDRFAILRPLDIIDSATPQNTINRVSNDMLGVVAQKLSSHPQGISANAGDNVTYTIKIKNQGSEAVYLRVNNTLNANTTLVSTTGINENGVLAWNVELASGQAVELSYVVKINDDVADGTVLTHGDATVNGVKLYCADIHIENTLTASQQTKLDALARTYVGQTTTVLDVANAVYSDAEVLGVDMGYTTPAVLYNEIYSFIEGTRDDNGNNWNRINAGYNVVVDTLYGGYYVASSSEHGERTQIVKDYMLMTGDILVVYNRLATSRDAYLVLANGEVMAKSDTTVKILTESERDYLFETLLAQRAFAVVRPSYSN